MRNSLGFRLDKWEAAFWFWKPCLIESRALSVGRRVVRVRHLEGRRAKTSLVSSLGNREPLFFFFSLSLVKQGSDVI